MTRVYLVLNSAIHLVYKKLIGRITDPEAWRCERDIAGWCVPIDVETDLRGMVRVEKEWEQGGFERRWWGRCREKYELALGSDGRFGYDYCELVWTLDRWKWRTMEFEWPFGTEWEKVQSDMRAIEKEVRSLGLMCLAGLELPNELEREVMEYKNYM